MLRPSGAHAGFMSNTLSWVIHRDCCDPISMETRSEAVLSMRLNTSRFPSGDHFGSACATASLESDVTWRGLPPSASEIQIRRGPDHAASKASSFPLGEYAGLKALSTILLGFPV